MSIKADFELLYIIISLIVISYFIIHSRIVAKRISKKRFISWVTLRFLTIACLLLVLFNVQLLMTNKDNTTVFLVDRSLSMSDDNTNIEEYINKQIKGKEDDDQFSVISFARDTMIEVPLTKESQTVRLETDLNQYSTNLEEAIKFTIDYFPENTNKRLVLLTDGKVNSGEISGLSKSLEENNVNLVVHPIKDEAKKDVQLTKLYFPKNIHYGEQIPVILTIDSNQEANGKFYLYNGKTSIIEEEIQVKEGVNQYEFTIPINDEGNINYRGEISFDTDTNLNNNQVNNSISVQGKPKILIIGEERDVANIQSLVSSSGIKSDSYIPLSVPSSIDFLSQYQEVIMANVSHQDIIPAFEKNLEIMVKQKGTGLIIVGGEQTFALGGYKDTLLEKILPVESRMKGKKKQPNTGLVLLIDASGSMDDDSEGVKKIEMAKEAAIRSVEALDTEDYVGVLAFSDHIEWVVPYQQVQNKNGIIDEIGKLNSGGGTLILPGLKEALNNLNNSETKVKHIILLTDGQGEKDGYAELVEAFKKNKISLSSVAFGRDSDKELLKYLSQSTDGRDYFAIDYHSVPDIFAKETYLATKKYLNNRELTPTIIDAKGLFKTAGLPKLQGYVGTSIKDGAELILQSDTEDPILATWLYGLGKVTVWTPDMNGKWSNDWIKWQEIESFWNNLINYNLPQNAANDIAIDISQVGDSVEVFVDMLSDSSNQPDSYDRIVELIVYTPDKIEQTYNMSQVMAGKYQTSFSFEQNGEYSLTIRAKENDVLVKNETRIIHSNYSPEYSLKNADIFMDKHVLKNSLIVDDASDVFELDITESTSTRSLDFVLLPLALCFFIADIGVRRIN